MTSYANLINTKQMLCNWLFLNNISKAHAHYLATLMTLRKFISLRAFTVYMENSLRFEISFRSIWPKWSLHRSEFHSTRSQVNADNEVTSHRSEFYPQVKSQTSLIRVSWKRALILLKYETFQAVWTISAPLSKLDILVGICPWFWLHFKTFL